MSERCRKSVRAPLIDRRWWLHIPSDDTKSHRVDERQVPEFITDAVNSYIETHRPVLSRGHVEQLGLWISSTTGRQLTTKNLGTLISKITREAIGVDVSPHLFRTAGASTAAVHGGNHPPRQRGSHSPRSVRHRGTLQSRDEYQRRRRVRDHRSALSTERKQVIKFVTARRKIAPLL
jgi:hypothetical protein